MADNSIARVYQFLNTYYSSIDEWKNEVDERYGNGDRIMIKSEFSSFMHSEFDFEVDDNQNDIINKFWASIDTKTTGKVGGTGIANVNALDKDELEKAEVMLQLSNKIGEFLQTKSSEYQNLGLSNLERWKNSVKEGMMNKLASQNISLDDQSKLDELMERAYQQTVRKATADCVADDVIMTEINNNSSFSGITYASEDDKELQKVIDRYIKSLDSDEKTPLSQIVSEVKKLVQAYADTAKTNSQSSLDTLGASYNANGKLNDLQMAVLVKEISDGINNKLSSDSNYSTLYAAYGDMIDAKIKPFVENALKGKKASEFNSIKGDISSYVDKFFTSELAEIEKEYNELQDAKKELKDYLSGKYTEKFKPAIKEVFGKDTQSEVEAVIDGYKTLAEVQAAKSAIEAKFDEIGSQLDDSFFSALKDTTVAVGQSKTIQLQNYTDKYSTGELTFSVENGRGVVSVNPTTGLVTITGTSAGQYGNITVSVSAGGKKLGTSSPINITVISAANATWGTSKASLPGADHGLSEGDEGLRIWGGDKKYDDQSLKNAAITFADLYNGNYNIELGTSAKHNKDNRIVERLRNLGNAIVDALAGAGFDKNKLQQASKNVCDRWIGDTDRQHDGWGWTTHKEFGGVTDLGHVASKGCNKSSQRRKSDSTYNKMSDYLTNGTYHGIIQGKDEKGNNQHVFMINFKEFVDAIIEEYNKIA